MFGSRENVPCIRLHDTLLFHAIPVVWSTRKNHKSLHTLKATAIGIFRPHKENKMTISLREMTEKIGKNPSLESLMALGETYMEFSAAMDECGTDILRSVSREDLKTAADIIRSIAISDALTDGTLNGQQVKFLMSESFLMIFAVIFKMSVGLAAMEEWR